LHAKQNDPCDQQQTPNPFLQFSNIVRSVLKIPENVVSIFQFVKNDFSILRNKNTLDRYRFRNRRYIVKEKIKAFLHREEGLTIVEYAVAAGLITATVAAAFGLLGAAVETVITTVTGYI
jgi:pilus assembly protein Flp/PilA